MALATRTLHPLSSLKERESCLVFLCSQYLPPHSPERWHPENVCSSRNSLIRFQFHPLGWMTTSKEGERNPESSIKGSWAFLLGSHLLRSQACKNSSSLRLPTRSFVGNNTITKTLPVPRSSEKPLLAAGHP